MRVLREDSSVADVAADTDAGQSKECVRGEVKALDQKNRDRIALVIRYKSAASRKGSRRLMTVVITDESDR